MSFLYISNINHLLDIQLVNIFSHSVHCLFILWIISFAVAFQFDVVLFIDFLLLLLVLLVSYPKKSLPRGGGEKMAEE